jgi:hypothetical protein
MKLIKADTGKKSQDFDQLVADFFHFVTKSGYYFLPIFHNPYQIFQKSPVQTNETYFQALTRRSQVNFTPMQLHEDPD